MSDSLHHNDNERIGSFLGTVFGNLIVASSAIPIGLFLFSLLGRYFYLAELAGNFRGQIFLLLLPFLMAAVLGKRWFTATLLLIVTVWSSIGVLAIFLPINQPPEGPKKLRIMSYNVLASATDYATAKKRIREVDPDVVMLVEYDHTWHAEMQDLITSGDYPFHAQAPRWHGFGVAMFSKFPVEESQVYQLTKEDTDVPMLVATVKVGDQSLRLAGMHPMSPTNSYRLNLRNQQFADAAKILKLKKTPTIVMGDFNCVPWSQYLSDFLETLDYRDSRQGFGYHGSWHRSFKPFMIPIDHAFVSPRIHVHDRYVARGSASDHLPVVVEISISPR